MRRKYKDTNFGHDNVCMVYRAKHGVTDNQEVKQTRTLGTNITHVGLQCKKAYTLHVLQLRQMKSGIITWMCTNSPTAPNALCDCKSCVCMPNWLNNLEPITSHQEIEGAAQSDYYQFHLPQLYFLMYMNEVFVSGSKSTRNQAAHTRTCTRTRTRTHTRTRTRINEFSTHEHQRCTA